MTYDDWKTTEPDTNPWFVCDVCERRFPYDERHHGFVCGIETTFCDECVEEAERNHL